MGAPLLDLDLNGLKRAPRDFEIAAEGADVAAIYFSGDGIQIGGTSYLLPTLDL